MAELFGFQITRVKQTPDPKQSFTQPKADDGTQTVAAGGYFGQYLDMEGTAKTEQDLIRRYREISIHPECDMAVEDIVNEAIVANEIEKDPVRVDLSDTDFSDNIKRKVEDEFKEVLKIVQWSGKKVLDVGCGTGELAFLISKKGAKVKTILTKNAKEFVTPLTVASLSQDKVYDALFKVENEADMDHISLSRWSDLILVAPATANTISKLSNGSSDDLASTVILASNKDIFLTPAMNVRMWEHPANKENLNEKS